MSELSAKLDQYIETKRKELETLGQNTGEFEVTARRSLHTFVWKPLRDVKMNEKWVIWCLQQIR